MASTEQIADIKTAIEQGTELPAMPAMASKLLQLKNDSNADAFALSTLIELDPSLAGQITHYAKSPFFGYKGDLHSIQNAIARVLGFDKALNIALGLSLGKSFKITPYGPIGIQSLWRHSVYSAALMQILAEKSTIEDPPTPGLSYLTGLMHNMGFLLVGHFFPIQFNTLNKTISANPDTPIFELEQQVLGTTHSEIGTWLMRKWEMPSEVIVGLFEHHNPDYRGQHSSYANLMHITDHLLKRYGIGDMQLGEVPQELLDNLGLSEIDAVTDLDRLIESSKSLDVMVTEMVKG